MTRWKPAVLSPSYIESMSIPEPNTGCWLWLGSYGMRNYAQIRIKSHGRANAHRASFKAHNPDVDIDGLDIDHKCRNPACVNPDHLEAVSHQENCRRRNAATNPTCRRGHDYDYVDVRGSRRCTICDAIAAQKYRDKEKARG